MLDGLEYLRIATLGLPYPGHEGKRVVVIGGGFTSMDCTRTSIRQGATEVTLVYRRDMKDMPAANEVHEAIEEGAPAIFQAGPTRVVTDENNKVTGVEFQRMALGAPDASGRRRPEPAPGTEFMIECDRVLLAIGQGPELDWLGPGLGRRRGHQEQRRLAADAVTFATGRPGVFGTGDVRIGAATVVQAVAEGRRAAYAIDAYLKGQDLDAIRTRQTLAEPQPEFLSIVPFTGEVKEPRYRLKAMPAEVRNKSYVEYEIPYTPQEAMAESTRCLQCTCEAIGYCDLRRQGIEYGTTLQTLEPETTGRRLPQRDREPLHRHQPRLHPRRHPRVHPARAVALHRLRPLRQRVQGGRRRRVLRLHAHRLRHARHHAARHEPQRHAVRLLRPLRRDVPDRRADAQAARPARSTRSTRAAASCAASASMPAPTTRSAAAPTSSSSHTSRAEPMIDLHGHRRDRPRHRDHATSGKRARLAARARRPGPLDRRRAGCCRCCRRGRTRAVGNGHGTTATAMAPATATATATAARATARCRRDPIVRGHRRRQSWRSVDRPVPRLGMGRPALPDPRRDHARRGAVRRPRPQHRPLAAWR